jgi:N-methylhydantoinase A/oxoprolinase/acetone carboxylase beta subunit
VITTTLKHVLEISKVLLDEIVCLIISTTSLINSAVEQDARHLKKVGILRVSKPFLREILPFSEFPPGLAKLCDGYLGYVDGGLAINGSQEGPVNENQVLEHYRRMKGLEIKSVVVAGVFSPIDEAFYQEDRVQELVLREMPGVDVVCSHRVANIGFKKWEDTLILNASILHFARRTIRAFNASIQEVHLSRPLYLTRMIALSLMRFLPWNTLSGHSRLERQIQCNNTSLRPFLGPASKPYISW